MAHGKRYRSAVELHHDLRACRAQLATASASAGASAARPEGAGGLRALLRRMVRLG